jgi:hypothetical protein
MSGQHGLISLDQLITRVKRYPTWRMLAMAHELSLKEEEQKDKPWKVERLKRFEWLPRREYVYITQFDLAFLAKLSILYSSDLRRESLEPNAVFELIALCGSLDEPFLHRGDDKFALWAFLLRTAWLQFPPQSGVGYLLPRYYLMFRSVNDGIAHRRFDVPSAWEGLSGLTVEDTMALGFVLWARAGTAGFFESRQLQNPDIHFLRELATDEKLERLLALAGADYQGFRDLQEEYRVDDPLYAKTEFNALVKRPVIQAAGRGWIAPIPRLVVERFTQGIFFDLLDGFSGAKRNDFLDYFGTLFEEYVGMLLRDGWGDSNVIHEPRYGRQEKRGPDWIVLEGEKALLFECRSSRLRLPTKVVADEQALRADVRRMFVEPLKKYQGKIHDLKNGTAKVNLGHVRHFYPCIAVAEKIYLEHIYRDIIDDELRAAGVQPFDYYLIDIEVLEFFSGWAAQTSVAAILGDWSQARLEEPPTDFEIWVKQKAREMNLNFDCPVLRRTLDAFRDAYLPTGPRQHGAQERVPS